MSTVRARSPAFIQTTTRRPPLARSRGRFHIEAGWSRSDLMWGTGGGVRRVSQHAAPATASSGYPPSLRPNSAILDATGAQEKTYTAVKQNTAPGMDAAFCIRACAQCVELSGSIGSASRRRGRVGRPTEVTEDEREVRPAHLAVLVMSAFSTELAPQSESR